MVEERRRLVGTWHRLDPWPDVRSGLDALRRQRPTAALSNAHVALLVDLARHADLRFDCRLSAEVAQVYKPAPEVYQTAARLLGVEPAALMLVAAHPLDLRGARAAGLQTAFATARSSTGWAPQRATIPRRTSLWETYTSWQSG